MEVEDEDDVGNSPADTELEANSPLVNESSEMHDAFQKIRTKIDLFYIRLGIVEQSPTPLVNNYTCNPRNLVWRVKYGHHSKRFRIRREHCVLTRNFEFGNAVSVLSLLLQ